MQAKSSEAAETSQSLQYFSFVRSQMEAKQQQFWIGNPSASIINGTLFLKPGLIVQTSQEISGVEQYVKQYRNLFISNRRNQKAQQNKKQSKVLRTLLLTGIPNSKCPIEICEKLQPFLDSWIIQIKVIKMNYNKYYGMLLLTTSSEVAQKLFYQIFGDEYNAVQMQRILIREIQGCTIVQTGASKIQNNSAIFQARKKSSINEEMIQKHSIEQLFQKSGKQPSKTYSFSPKKKQHNVPPTEQSKQCQSGTTCSICFQEFDNAIISLLCSHYFHIKCLSQWKQNKCPLCRYHLQPPLIKFCQKCNQCEGLWICLVCGVRLCCGQEHNILGNGSHIYEHYLESYHRLSMDVQTKFLFDASQPAFLHQMLYKEILKNEENLEMGPSKKSKKGKKNKLSEKISEYQQSISEEMHRQRMYFEENISKQVKMRKQLIKQKRKIITQYENQIAELNKQLEEVEQKKQQYEIGTVNYEKELKAVGEVKKYWKSLSDQNQKISMEKTEIEKKQIKALDQMIALKNQQLKDFLRNIELSGKIKSNIGKDQVQKAFIIGNIQKEKKKKK